MCESTFARSGAAIDYIIHPTHGIYDTLGRYDHQQAQHRRTVARSQPRPKTVGRIRPNATTTSAENVAGTYHGRTTQVEERASLSRAWLYELVHRDRHHSGNLYKCLTSPRSKISQTIAQ